MNRISAYSFFQHQRVDGASHNDPAGCMRNLLTTLLSGENSDC